MSKRLKQATIFASFTLLLAASSPLFAQQDPNEYQTGSSEWVKETFSKGKSFYYDGNYDAAVAEWGKLDPYLNAPENQSTKRMLDFLKSRMPGGSVAPSPAAAQPPAIVYPKPAAAPSVNADALRRTVDQAAQSVRNEAANAPPAAVASGKDQAWVYATFQKGKAYMDAGNLPMAIEQWESITPYVDNRREWKDSLDNLRDAWEARAKAIERSQATAEKPQVPQSLMSVINTANEKLRNDLLNAERESLSTDKKLSEQQLWVVQTFHKGDELYDQGRYKEALKEWESIEPYLEGQDELEQLFAALKENFQKAINAKKSAEQVKTGGPERFKAPAELLQLLNDADKKMQSETEDALAASQNVESSAASRGERLRAQMEKAKFLYEDGQYKEALDTWYSITPQFEDEVQLKTTLKFVQTNYERWQKANEALKAASGERDAKQPAPEDLPKLLREASQKMEGEAKAAESARTQAEKSSGDRKAWLDSTYRQGLLLYQQGDVPGATGLWASMLPYVEDADTLRAQIDRLKAIYSRSQEAQKAASAAAARKDEKFTTPAEWERTLAESEQRLTLQTQNAASERARMEKEVADRWAWIETVFNNGRTLFQKEQVPAAIAEWERLEPYLDASSDIKPTLERIKAVYTKAKDARRSTEEFAAHEYKELKVPYAGEMQAILNDADIRFNSEADSADAELAKMEKTLAQRQAWIRSIFEKGKAHYEDGRLDEAIETWRELLPYIDEGTKMGEFMETVLQSRSRAVEAQKVAAETASRTDLKFQAPEGFALLLDSISQRYTDEHKKALARTADAEKTVTERKAAVTASFVKGKQLYQEGKLDEAMKEWASTAPALENADEIQMRFRAIQQSRASAASAQAAAQSAAGLKDAKIQAPEELSALLLHIQEGLDASAEAALADKRRLDDTIAERQSWVASIYQKGKALYEAGQLKEAMAAWSAITPYLENGNQIKQAMQNLQESEKKALELRAAADAAERQRTVKFQAPDELTLLLTDADVRLAGQIAQSENLRREAEAGAADRQAWVRSMIDKGRLLYESGKVDEAAEVWGTLAPYMEKGADFKAKLKNLQEAHARAAEASAAADAAVAQKEARFAPPEELTALITDADARFKKETQEAIAQRDRSEKALSSRQAWASEVLQKAQKFYNEGQYLQAAQEWAKLGTYFDPKSGVPQLIQMLKQSLSDMTASKKAAVEAAANEYKGLRVPPELPRLLDEAGQKLAQDLRQANTERAAAEEKLAERQQWLTDSVAKAAELYAEGRFEEAIRIWDALIPYLQGDEQIRIIIQSLKARFEEMKKAQADAAQAAERTTARLRAPERYFQDITKADEDMKRQAGSYASQQLIAEKAFEDRRAAVADILQKAQAAYDAGNLPGAIELWRLTLPSIEEESVIKDKIDAVEKAYQNAAAAKAAADEAFASKDRRFKLDDGLRNGLGEVAGRLDAQTSQLRSQEAKAAQALAEREALVAATLKNAGAYFEKGRYEDALKEWDSIAGQFENADELKKMLDSLRRDHQAMADAKAAANQAIAKNNMKFKAPAEFAQSLAAASQALQASAQKSLAQRAEMEKQVADRQAAMLALFKKGTELYQKGQVPDAIVEWSKLDVYLDADSSLKPLLEQLRQDHAKALAARKSADDFAANGYKELKLPYADEMAKLLNEADAKLKNEAKTYENRRAETEKILAERQEWVAATFQKGKVLYEQGRYDEAVEVWDTVTPYLQDESKVKDSIQTFDEAYQNYIAARNAAVAAGDKKNTRYASPEDISKLLAATNEKLKVVTNEARTQTAEVSKLLNDRKNLIANNFDKGRELYQQGKYKEAIVLWKEVLPYLEDESKIREAIVYFENNLNDYLEAKTAAEQAAARKDSKYKSPQEMLGVLAEANEILRTKGYEAKTSAAEIDKSVADRRASVQSSFEKGKALHDQGKYKEAIDVWRQMVPNLEDAALIQESLDNAERAYQSAVEAQGAAAASASKKNEKFETPSELPKLLAATAQKLKYDNLQALGQTALVEKERQDRLIWVETTFQKGKSFFEAGEHQQAMDVWRSLIPYLKEGDQIENSLEQLAETAAAAAQAKQKAQGSTAQRTAKFDAPGDLIVYLRQADEQLKNESFEAQNQKAKAEQSLEERRQFIASTFKAGVAYYDDGKYGQAVDEWVKLEPYLDEASGLPKLLAQVRQSHQSAMDSKRAAVEAAASEYKGLQLSYKDQMMKLLTDANKKLLQETAGYRTKQDEVEQTLAERKEWAANTFTKGKAFYDQARYDDALEQWGRLLPYLGEDSALAKQIENLRKSYTIMLESKKNIESAEGQKPGQSAEFKEGSEMSRYLDEANKKLREKIQEYNDQISSVEKSAAERSEWMSFVYKKGKALYDQNDYEGAIKQWALLTPYLDEEPELKAMVERARQSATEKEAARRNAVDVRAKAEALPMIPAQAVAEQASGRMAEQAASLPAAEPVAEPVADEEPHLSEEAGEPVVAPAEPSPAPADAQQTPSAGVEGVEFVSGEIAKVDDLGKTITLKLYAGGKGNEITVSFDDKTELSSTSSGTTIQSLQSGAAVDVRYDLRTSRALYIYIY